MRRILFLSILFVSIQTFSQKKPKIKWVVAISQEMSKDFESTPIFRLPVMVVCNNGDIVIGAEAKSKDDKFQFYALALSEKGKIFMSKRSNIPMAELVYDTVYDRIFSYGGSKFYASDDHGKTWYDFNSKIHINKPDSFDIVNMSPTSGIQLKNGILVIPLRFIRFKRDSSGKQLRSIEKTVNTILYSKDYGKNWFQSAMTPIDVIADEVALVEYKDNQIMLNSRGGTEYFWDATNNGRRVFIPKNKSNSSVSRWKIDGWKLENESDGKIYDPICHASIIKAEINNKKIGLFCNPDMPGQYYPRKNLCLWASKDFKHWRKVVQMTPTDYPVLGYSAMAYRNGNLCFAYEDKQKGILFCDMGILKQTIIKKVTN